MILFDYRKPANNNADLEAHFDQSSSQTTDIHKSTTDSAYGPIFTKIRKMIVVACHACRKSIPPLAKAGDRLC